MTDTSVRLILNGFLTPVNSPSFYQMIFGIFYIKENKWEFEDYKYDQECIKSILSVPNMQEKEVFKLIQLEAETLLLFVTPLCAFLLDCVTVV